MRCTLLSDAAKTFESAAAGSPSAAASFLRAVRPVFAARVLALVGPASTAAMLQAKPPAESAVLVQQMSPRVAAAALGGAVHIETRVNSNWFQR